MIVERTKKWLSILGLLFLSIAIPLALPIANFQFRFSPSFPFITVINTAVSTNPQKLKTSAEADKLTLNAPGSKILFFDALSGPDRLVTNEYVYWSNDSCPYTSDKWEMTSGSLSVKNNAGYSGVPTDESQSRCDSSVKNNSALFRLTTKDHSFGNATTMLAFMMVQHGGGGASSNAYDGVHVLVRYQTEFALYAVTVSRWDGVIVIKKKVPVEIAKCSDPSNGGCYYNLTQPVARPDLAGGNIWHHVDVIVTDDSAGRPNITLKIDSIVALQAVDNDTHGPPYHSGAVGVRGDNTEFYFKNLAVIAQ